MSAEFPETSPARDGRRSATAVDPALGSPTFDAVVQPAGGSGAAPTQAGRGKALGWVIAIALAIVVGIGAYAVFAGGDDDEAAPAAGGPAQASIARGTSDVAALRLEGSVGSVLLRTDAADDQLVAVEATGADATAQLAEGEEAVATLRGDASTVQLAPEVAWRLALGADTDSVTANLLGAKVSGVDVTTGARSIDLTLPAPEGQVVVDLKAGMGAFVLHVPDGVAVLVDVVAGAGSVMVDDRTEQGVEAGSQIPTEGFVESDAHYVVKVSSGVGSVMVHHDAA